MIALAMAAALARPPELALQGAIGAGPGDVRFGAGGGAELGLHLTGPLRAVTVADLLLLTSTGQRVSATGGLRLFLRDALRPSPSLLLAGGVIGEEGVAPLLTAGLAVDLERSPGVRPRLQLAWAQPVGRPGRAVLSAGAVFGRAPRPDPQATPASRTSLTQPRPRQVRTDEPGMTWVTQPVCQWLPTDEANTQLALLGLQAPPLSRVSARLLRAPDAPPEAPRLAPQDAGPRPASVVVAALAGDRVTVDGVLLESAEGVAVGRTDEGEHEVRVVGGGRSWEVTVALVDDHAVWLTPPPPEPTRVSFPVGSARVDATTRQLVGRLAADRGRWSYRVRGGYSDEGALQANLGLAQRRAEAIAAALRAAGVPAEALVLADPLPPDPAVAPEGQRQVLIEPLEST